jgi:hypothetical protein
MVTGLLSFGVWQHWWVATLMLAAVVLGALHRATRTAPRP